MFSKKIAYFQQGEGVVVDSIVGCWHCGHLHNKESRSRDL